LPRSIRLISARRANSLGAGNLPPRRRLPAPERRLDELTQAINAAGLAGDPNRVRTLGADYETAAAHLQSLWDAYEKLPEP